MKQSTTFAQVATNLLNVLQGYSKSIRLLLVMFLILSVSAEVWGAETTYTFTSKEWNASPDNWTLGKAGAGFTNDGIQVTTTASGANATSPISFNNISQIIVTYNTNKSAGAGTLDVKIGDNSKVSQNWKYSSGDGRTAKYTATFNFSPAQSGYVNLTANTTTNSIYVVSIKIVTANTEKYTVTLKDDNSTLTQSIAGEMLSLPTREGCDGYTFAGWTNTWEEAQTTWTTTAPTIINAGSYTPTANENLYPVYTKNVITEGGKGESKTITLSTPTTTTSYQKGTKTDSEDNTWSYYAAINNVSGTYEFGLNSNANNYNIGSPVFNGNVTSVTFKARNASSSEARKFLFCSTNTTAQPTTGDLAEVSIPKNQQFTNTYTADLSQSNISQFYIYAPKALGITAISVTYTTSGSGTTSTPSYISVPSCTTETTVTLNPNGGLFEAEGWEYDGGNYTQNIVSGDEITLPTPAKKGYYFNGWSDGTYSYTDTYTVPAEDVTLNALWKPIEYQITYKGLEGATNGDNPNTYTVESETITFEKPGERVGYIFKGWEPEIIEAGSTGNVTIIATWEKIVLSNNCKWIETEIGEIEPEDEVVVTMTNGVTTWALDQDYYKSGDKYPLATTLEVSGNEITQIYDKIKWNISGNATEGYILYPNGQTNTWLYCTGSSNTIKIGDGSPKHFVIENGYLKSKSKVTTSGLEVDAFLGVSTSTNSWRHYPNTTTSVISGQTLKFYKKTCLMSNEFWIDYELANVTCINTPPPFASR